MAYNDNTNRLGCRLEMYRRFTDGELISKREEAVLSVIMSTKELSGEK